jgi:predicted nucleic acid-binding protein
MSAGKGPAPLSSSVKYLLDVNVLLAAMWASHPQHAKAFAWLTGKSVVLCPLTELGFLRISTTERHRSADGRSSEAA